MKPIIGIMPLWDEDKSSIWMLPGYMDGITEAGGLPIMLPLTAEKDDLHQLVSSCDGLLFTGGQDVSPHIYGEEPLEGLVEACAQRDEMELIVLKEALAADMPLLGICRGIQFINAALGGTLYQDLLSQHPSETNHQQQAPYDEPIHEVSVLDGSPLQACLGVNRLAVNSCHHQAVKELAPDLVAMATSPDGLIEALYRPKSRFLWAVQWHPEFSHRVDAASRAIFRAFLQVLT